MALLVGKHLNKIDKKGRVSVPKPFRGALAQSAGALLYAYPLFKVAAIEACNEAFMERLSKSLDDLDLFSEEQDDAALILETAHLLSFDPEGRVVLPEELLSHADISKDVLFVGRGARFQIWQPKAYEAHHRKAFERAAARGATIRLRPEPDGGGAS
jgi:MraZ protein